MMFTAMVVCVLGQADGTLDATFAAWQQRYQDFGAVEIVAEGEVITTPDLLAGLGAPTKDLLDKPQPIRLHAKLDFPNERVWIRREESRWNVPQSAFERIITETTATENKTLVREIDAKTQRSSTRIYEGSRARSRVWQQDTMPMWINSGIVTLGNASVSLFEFPDYEGVRQQSEWSVIPDDAEKTDGILKVTVAGLKPSSATYTVQIDSDDAYIVRRVQSYDSEDRLTTDIRISYRETDGHVVVTGWESAGFAGADKLLIHAKVTVKQFDQNCQFPESVFAVEDGG